MQVLFLSAAALLLALGVFFLLPRHQITHSSQAITRDIGREMYPAQSPNGHYLVYLRATNSEARRLYLKDLTQPDHSDRALVTEHAQESAAVWENDSAAIIFAAELKGGGCFIVRYVITTQKTETITRCETPLPTRIALSPDGRYLLFPLQHQLMEMDRLNPKHPLKQLPCNSPCPLHAISDTGVYSPDGEIIVFTRRLSLLIEDLFWINRHSGETRRLTQGYHDIRGVAWTEQQSSIVFGAINDMQRDGYLLNIENGETQKLNLNGFSYPHVAKNNRLYYHYWVLHRSIGYVQWPGDGAPLPLLRSQYFHAMANYSASSDAYVLVSNQDGKNALWRYDPNNHALEKLFESERPVSFPSWSPDGKSIVYTEPKPDFTGDNLFIFDIESKSRQMIATSLKAPYRPSWFPDQKHIVVGEKVMGRTEIYRVNILTGDSERISDDEVRMAQVATDGEVYFTRKENDGIWHMRRNGDSYRVTDDRCNTSYNWTFVPGGLICEYQRKGQHHILFFSPTGKQPQLIATMPEGMLAETGSLDYDAKRKRITFTLDEPSEADIMLTELIQK